MTNNLIIKPAYLIAKDIKDKKNSQGEVYSFFEKRISQHNASLNAFVDLYKNNFDNQSNSNLTGVPIAIKDNICIKGKKITCASKILKYYQAVYDATVIKKLKSSGLSLIGTTNMDEFAFGSSTENSCYGPTKNPWDKTRVVGGSSGGSAAAVSARLVPFALGSDTGGSIRQPASFCGVVGLKPTYGRVSRYGLVAFGSSLDQIGPITTNIKDCAYLLNIISGFDQNDSTSAKVADPDFTKSLGQDVASLRIGLPKEYFDQDLNSEIKETLDQAIIFFKKKNIQFKKISLPHTQYSVPTYYIIASSEASSNLQRFDGIRYGYRAKADDLWQIYQKSRSQGFGDEAKRRVFLGTYSLSSGYYDAYYLKALKVRRLIKNDFDQAFKEVDAILTPTTPTAAFKIGEKIKDPLSMYLSDIYTISSNLAGIPAVSLPCGFTKDNLPLGMQLIAKDYDEATLIKLGDAFQQDTDFHKKIPELKNV
ncbi:MAG: Asp-tRNA(Asn)/Glu-tRNA(Gln) amidotransferase subunit GatA [Candidatus Omnitrophica bacterium]|nr:Asp-tRNA(Asn)/Glu-tRNA(Gln) amidotransferase subunit GatA [Candidatus Omnitrophota bacterium]MCF7894815.1 Asp-tRNA(Asn)/Glu-tRNA(Gln) amidotransferase subunit GatA [Candidatus Omnitrophota bacterium]